jgi:hypothetical protein
MIADTLDCHRPSTHHRHKHPPAYPSCRASVPAHLMPTSLTVCLPCAPCLVAALRPHPTPNPTLAGEHACRRDSLRHAASPRTNTSHKLASCTDCTRTAALPPPPLMCQNTQASVRVGVTPCAMPTPPLLAWTCCRRASAPRGTHAQQHTR